MEAIEGDEDALGGPPAPLDNANLIIVMIGLIILVAVIGFYILICMEVEEKEEVKSVWK